VLPGTIVCGGHADSNPHLLLEYTLATVVNGVRTVVDTGSFHDVGVPALGGGKLVVLVLCVAELLTAAIPDLYTEDICSPGCAVIP
jgi:hypothetical protein